MASFRWVRVSLVVLVSGCLLSSTAGAQQAVSGIAGVVKDTSGAVMPGVTVEASSPALIEKARTVVTNGDGQYKIVDLRPGSYTVTFTLAGFNTVKRDGIELSGGVTATVNADLRVGALEETVTVSGEAPTVDVQNVRQQNVLARDLLDTLPSGARTIQSFGTLTPGFVVPPANRDVGGSQGEVFFFPTIHGTHGSDSFLLNDGMPYTSAECGGCRGTLINAGSAQEIVMQTGAISAEIGPGGLTVNVVPKEGSNRFNFYFNGNYTNTSLQVNNIDDDLRARGLTGSNSVDKVYDFNIAAGGPIVKDRLWFYTAHRQWGNGVIIAGNYFNATQNTPFYTADLSRPAIRNEHDRSTNLRLTWQASPKNKINIYGDYQDDCSCRGGLSGTTAPEAAIGFRFLPAIFSQVTWTSPVTSRMLLEAGVVLNDLHWDNFYPPEVTAASISTVDLTRGYTYGSGFGWGGHQTSQANQRFAMTYVTGSHAFKTGFYALQSWRVTDQNIVQDVQYSFINNKPASLTQYGTPYTYRDRIWPDVGLYAQDQWTVRRVTLNLGIRFDYIRGYVPEEPEPANRYLPARTYPELTDVPNFKDINPRLGASWNVFGDGKTAVKGSIGRYVASQSTSGPPRSVSPAATVVNSASRTWTDANSNYVPDCNFQDINANGECGRLSAPLGSPAVVTHYDSSVLTGFGQRGYDWQSSAELQQELRARMSVKAGYYRIWYGNFNITDNLALSPATFDPYCVTAPTDARLPGGGGYQVCGLYDVKPSSFGQVNNLVTQAASIGNQTETSNFFDLTWTWRYGQGGMVSAAVDTGRTETNNCAVVNGNPQVQFTNALSNLTAPRANPYCDVVTPYGAQTQFKVFGTYPLPWWGLMTSATWQNLSGIPDYATYVATNAQIAPSLGRNLAAGANGTVTLDLVAPQTQFEGRMNQVDFRLAKNIKIGQGRVQLQGDLYNLFNASTVLGINPRFGPAWLTPTSILGGRLVKFGIQITY